MAGKHGIALDGYNFIGDGLFGKNGYWGPANNYSVSRLEEKRIPLYVGLRIYDIYSIDLTTSTFAVKFGLFISWQPGMTADQLDVFRKKARPESRRYYVPDEELEEFCSATQAPRELSFANTQNGFLDGVAKENPFVDLRTGDVHMFYFGSTVMRQKFDLRNFPFDTHELEIDLWNNHSADMLHFDLVVYAVDLATARVETPEWHIHAPKVDRKVPENTIVSLCISRKHAYYTRNLVSFLSLLNFVTLTSFALDPTDELGDRLANTIALLLTLVAFKFMVSDSLPKVAYYTWFDEWAYACSLLTFAQAFFFAIGTSDWDHVARRVFACCYTVLPCVWVVFAIWSHCNVRAKFGRPLRGVGDFIGFQFADTFFLKVSPSVEPDDESSNDEIDDTGMLSRGADDECGPESIPLKSGHACDLKTGAGTPPRLSSTHVQASDAKVTSFSWPFPSPVTDAENFAVNAGTPKPTQDTGFSKRALKHIEQDQSKAAVSTPVERGEPSLGMKCLNKTARCKKGKQKVQNTAATLVPPEAPPNVIGGCQLSTQ